MLHRRVVHVRSQFCGGNTGKDSQQAVGTHATLRMLSLAFPLWDLWEEGCLKCFEAFFTCFMVQWNSNSAFELSTSVMIMIVVEFENQIMTSLQVSSGHSKVGN